MNISSLAGALWAAGFLEHVALLLVLLVRRRWRTFRFFTAFITFNVVRTIVLFLVFRLEPMKVYAGVYWSATVIDLILQILVILEAMRIVLRPAGIWAEDARKRFWTMAGGGFVLAVGVAFAIHPHLPNSLRTWIEQGQLYSVSLSVVLLIAMAASTTALGLVWTRHVTGLATGWAAWVFSGFFLEGAYSYLGPQWQKLDLLRIVVYQLVTIYWAIMFWIPEPERRTLAREQQEYLRGLHELAGNQLDMLSVSRKR